MSYPTINYIGNKEKIVSWIISLIPKDATSILDVFSGGCSVRYAAKQKGLTVYTNDILTINYYIGKSLIENEIVTLGKNDVDRIFQGEPFEGFMPISSISQRNVCNLTYTERIFSKLKMNIRELLLLS